MTHIPDFSPDINEDFEEGDPQDIVLPFRWQKSLISDDVREILRSICTPFKSSHPGDILAVKIDVTYHHTLTPYPIREILIKDEIHGVRTVKYVDLRQDQRPILADAVMRLSAMDLNLQQLCAHLFDAMSNGAGEREYFSIIYAPYALLIHHENYMDEIFEGRYCGDDLDQHQVNEAMIMLADPDGTGHEKIACLKALPELAKMFIASAPIAGSAGDTVVPVSVPDFNFKEDEDT